MPSTMRGLKFETLSLQRETGLDGQGKPTYGSTLSFEANAVLEKQQIRLPDGSESRSDLTLYVKPDETNIPNERDRVIRNSIDYIAMEKTEPSSPKTGDIDHYRIRCREENGYG